MNLTAFQPIYEMIVVGDVHGRILDLNTKAIRNTRILHFQVGDLGAGFANLSKLCPNIIWTRGNHDDPKICYEHPSYAGDYGHLRGKYKSLYYIGGGYSIDQDQRIPGISWWENEELSYEQLDNIIDDVVQKKPQVMITHECPTSIIPYVGFPSVFGIPPSRTAQALERILEQHKPVTWLFGHHHMSLRQVIQGVQFICLKELEAIKINL
jgi:predicted phosphohydrolase